MQLLRLLPRFRKAYQALAPLEAREWWSRAAIEDFQLERINTIWLHATRHVPYYRALRVACGLPQTFRSLVEYTATVPLLAKGTVKARPDEFLSEHAGRGRWHRTGGSTGSPMSVYWATDSHQEMLRAKYRMDAAWGLDIFDRKVFLWGHGGSFAPGLAGRLARWRQPWEDRLRNRLRLSAYQMGTADLQRYLRLLAAFRPASLYGYSTALYLLAEEAAAARFRCDSLRLATMSGEPAFPGLTAAIERALGVPAVVEYGAVECGFIAGQGPDRTLRVREDMTLVETLPRADGGFDIVVSVLNNPSFPLLRYAIDDVTDAPLQVPGAGFAILHNVWGRRNDLVVSRSGRLVHSIGIKHIFEHCHGVRRFRAHQDLDGKVSVVVEASDRSAPPDTTGAERQLQDLLEAYPVSIAVVDAIPGTLAGKHRWVVSDLAAQRLGLSNAPAPHLIASS
jgi:phenylacetate-CoA ligase